MAHWYQSKNSSSKDTLTYKSFLSMKLRKLRAVTQMPPHVSLMKRLEIADYEPGSDPGNLRWYPKGRMIKSLLEQYVTSQSSSLWWDGS